MKKSAIIVFFGLLTVWGFCWWLSALRVPDLEAENIRLKRRVAALENLPAIVEPSDGVGDHGAVPIALYQHPLKRVGKVTTSLAPIADFPELSVAIAEVWPNRQAELALVKGTNIGSSDRVELHSYYLVYPDSTERKVLTVALPSSGGHTNAATR